MLDESVYIAAVLVVVAPMRHDFVAVSEWSRETDGFGLAKFHALTSSRLRRASHSARR